MLLTWKDNVQGQGRCAAGLGGSASMDRRIARAMPSLF